MLNKTKSRPISPRTVIGVDKHADSQLIVSTHETKNIISLIFVFTELVCTSHEKKT